MSAPFAPPRGPQCPPHLHLQQASAGDWLPGVKAHVDGCAACAAELAALQQRSAAFLAARPKDRFLAQLDTRAAAARKPRSAFLVFALVSSMALLLSVGLTQLVNRGSGVTLKGGLSSITLKRGEAITSLGSDTRLAPGDALRFSVLAPRDGFALVLEKDATGKVTVVAPFGAKEPFAVPAGTIVLPDSAVLDGVRGRETFITLFSERPFDVQRAVQAFERDETRAACDGCQVEVSTFDKP